VECARFLVLENNFALNISPSTPNIITLITLRK
jgi:hypothetical protein